MQKLIDKIYQGAITEVFTSEALRDPFFGCLCYQYNIDSEYSITILGNEIETECNDGEIDIKGKSYTIYICYKIYNENGCNGVEIMSTFDTYDNSYDSLYRHIGKTLEKCFGKRKISRAA